VRQFPFCLLDLTLRHPYAVFVRVLSFSTTKPINTPFNIETTFIQTSNCLSQFILNRLFLCASIFLRRLLRLRLEFCRFWIPPLLSKGPFREAKAMACDQRDGRNKAKDGAEPSEDIHVPLVPWLDFGPVILDGGYWVPDFGIRGRSHGEIEGANGSVAFWREISSISKGHPIRATGLTPACVRFSHPEVTTSWSWP